jgi:hypothetical protein
VTESYVTRKEMAQILGVKLTTLDKFVREGIPSETWGTHKRFFLPSAALRWAKKRGLSQRSGTVPASTKAGATDGTAPRHGTGKVTSHAT